MDMKFCLPPFNEYKLRGFENRVLRRVRCDVIYIYLLLLGFHPVAMVGKLVQK